MTSLEAIQQAYTLIEPVLPADRILNVTPTATDNEILEDGKEVRGIVYQITNTKTPKVYIGRTKTHYFQYGKYRPSGVQTRFSAHKCQKTTKCESLWDDMEKYGSENFTIKVLEYCPLNIVAHCETYHILKHKTYIPFGYNVILHDPVKHSILAHGIDSDVKDTHRKNRWDNMDVSRAIIRTQKGLAPRIIVIFETQSQQAVRRMKRTTFSCLYRESIEEVMVKATKFARQYTDNVDFVVISKMDMKIQKVIDRSKKMGKIVALHVYYSHRITTNFGCTVRVEYEETEVIRKEPEHRFCERDLSNIEVAFQRALTFVDSLRDYFDEEFLVHDKTNNEKFATMLKNYI